MSKSKFNRRPQNRIFTKCIIENLISLTNADTISFGCKDHLHDAKHLYQKDEWQQMS